MRITICGSSAFRKEKVAKGEAPELLQQINTEHSIAKKQYNFIKMYYDFIVGSDAIIVCNYDKKGVLNYIGSNTFLEMGYAHVHGKKIFLLNEIPDQGYILDEVKAMEPVILKGDLSKIG